MLTVSESCGLFEGTRLKSEESSENVEVIAKIRIKV
jgi:hypothetical protein